MPAHTMSATISPKRTRFLFSMNRYIASAITVMALSIIQIKFSMVLVIYYVLKFLLSSHCECGAFFAFFHFRREGKYGAN